MDLRESKSRLILIVAALGLGLVIAVASCSSGGGDSDDGAGGETSQETETEGSGGEEDPAGGEQPDPDEGAEPEVLAEVTGEQDITLAITRAERQTGGFLTIEGTVHNGGGDGWGTNTWAGEEHELAENGFSMAGATLIAREENKRYLILRDTEGRCLCTGFGLDIDAGETVTWFAQFPEPEPTTNEVDFQIGAMPPATIEIQ
ncbi:hypothetical protein ACTWP5_16800 [Streptomyces sp. 4N509B]|uniref:hypothetical protein n=1 Tax=Streptomyces sp. 4N509B TaxID=3457413 RepID=UPI003FD32D08